MTGKSKLAWTYEQFRRDFGGHVGFLPEYRVRSYYVGPAVAIDASELAVVIRATDLRLQWDRYGKSGLVVYPA